MKKMQNVTSGSYGVLEDFLIMDDEPILGQWTITSSAYGHYMDGSYYDQTVRQNKLQCTGSNTFKIKKISNNLQIFLIITKTILVCKKHIGSTNEVPKLKCFCIY